MTINLTRQQRRQMQRLAEVADKAIESDRRFFDRYPSRTYRVRLLSHAERLQAEIIQGRPIVAGPGQAVFVVMKQIAPGVRMKANVVGSRAYIGDELSDDEARGVYEDFAEVFPLLREREADMRAAVERLSKGQPEGGAA